MNSTILMDKLQLVKELINESKQNYIQMFDIVDQTNEEYTNLSDQERLTKIEEEFNETYDFDNLSMNMINNENEDEETPIFMCMRKTTTTTTTTTEELVEEQRVLSQRLSQLSTATLGCIPTDTLLDTSELSKHTIKKIQSMIKKTENDRIPNYLSSSSQLFKQIIAIFIEHPTEKDFDDLRQIAFFMHKRTNFRLLHDLWSTYFHIGKNHLQEVNNYQYWSNHVRSQINMITKQQIDCETFIHQRIEAYSKEIDSYEKQLNDKKQQCSPMYSSVMSVVEEAIQFLIEQYGLLPLQMKCQFDKTYTLHEYEDELLKQQFEQQHPTDYQFEVANSLYNLECKFQTSKYSLIEYQQRIICNKPPTSYDCLEITTIPTIIPTLSSSSIQSTFLNRYQKLIQQTKTDLMTIDLLTKQILMYQNLAIINHEKDKMYQNIRKQIPNKDISNVLRSLMDKRTKNIRQKLGNLHHFNMEYSIRNSFDQFEVMIKSERIGFLSTLITTMNSCLTSYFSSKELQLLNRGPTYVPPYQIRTSSAFSSIHDILIKQYAPLKHQLAVVFSKYTINIASATNFDNDIRQLFTRHFSIPLSNEQYQRAIYEQKIIQIIQLSLHQNNLLLRRIGNQTNQFLICKMNEFTCLEQVYMEKYSDHYRILFEMTLENQQQIEEEMKHKYRNLNMEFEKLHKTNRITNTILKRISILPDKIKLSYLYFLPMIDATATHIGVKPMIVTHGSGTSKLAQYLKQLLRPFVIQNMNKTMLLNETDFLERLHFYTDNEHKLKPHTLFATIQIQNYETIASHTSLIASLVNFLTDNLANNKMQSKSLLHLNKLQTISIDTIKQLTELYLQNNFFKYNGKIYQIVRGAPNNLPITEILLNIYLNTYENFIVSDSNLKAEFYGRYKDRIFFTWNHSQEDLNTFLHMIANKYAHIYLKTSSGQCIDFLNLRIENRQGYLYTCVRNGDQNQLKYTLPYVTGHIQLNHQIYLRFALIRAIRFCSNFLDFQMEQIRLEITFLINGYSIDFIEQQLKHFYLRFNAENIRFNLDQNVYNQLRRRVLDCMTIQRTLLLKNQQLNDEDFIFQFSYPYDYGSYLDLKKNFLLLWKKYFQDDAQLAHRDTIVNLKSKSIYSLNTLLFEKEK